VVYGFVGGLIVPAARLFPADVINQQSFLAVFGFPVQLMRAACAVALAVTIVRILRTFQAEADRRLQAALATAERSLSEAERLGNYNRLILATAGQGIHGLDVHGNITFANARSSELLGWTAEELTGRRQHDLIHHTRPDGTPFSSEACPILSALEEGEARHIDDELFWRKDGTSFHAEYTSTPMRENGTLIGAVVAFQDISERRAAEEHQRLAAMVLETMTEAVIVTDAERRIVSVNRAFARNTGYAPGEVLGRTPAILKSGHHDRAFHYAMWETLRGTGQWQGEIWNRRKNGEIYPEWLMIHAVRDSEDRVIRYVGVYSDVNRHEEVQRRIHHLAFYDGLTGLPNRELFGDRLGLALTQAHRKNEKVGVMFMDLDRFKYINDTLGHGVGDRLLKIVAERLKSTLREGDTIARIGGDEFTAILAGMHGPSHAVSVCEKILKELDRPVMLEGRSFCVTCSIGLSVFPDDGEDQNTLMKKADIAMYRAKELGRNNCQLYTLDMSARIHQRLDLESDLREALEKGELHMVYQPQADIRDGRLVGVEALARWRHPRLGDIPPATFIPIAEETGLIGRLGEWGMRTACRAAKEWVGAGGRPLRVAVNLSAHQLRQKGLPQVVANVIAEAGLRTDDLALELTESALIQNSEADVSTLQSLIDMGVQIAIDDFGTGYSSLSYLKRFSVGTLKIDRSFVKDIPEDANDRVLARMIIAVAHASKIKVIAEGVERYEQLRFLRDEGCDEIQGYLLSEPVPAEQITCMVRRDECVAAFHPVLARPGDPVPPENAIRPFLAWR
jgi:diguanylate cyclase (GGDEF)-like protein/PAS domain S-box-containing protein